MASDFASNSQLEHQFDRLGELRERKTCRECGKKRLYFCYDCRIYMDGIAGLVPEEIELPIELVIIKHPAEKAAKSTAIHCQLAAPCSTKFYDFPAPEIPQFDAADTAIIFPSQSALPIDQFLEQRPALRRLIVLDSTWNAVGQLRNMPQLRKLPCVALKKYTTEYWRPQKNYNDECLATIEAIYYAVREVQTAKQPEVQYDGRFEPLLFWFRFFKREFVDKSEGVKRIPGNNGRGRYKNETKNGQREVLEA
ncbi:unnamed protein product [Bursaphelenchus xylophilus]|uniref:tRNA-uridine aminocarboxypropyltransferase 1 n=1 Tax=Bursaphelenchus xylophilus TaxID=6326 RepID=A0A1I7S695_BURXY|nr:unnamed protein product [Bursaphelenchus xylophilus]CAG9128226.1 unnamed protein product [Bursaphelenchus xylophilus]